MLTYTSESVAIGHPDKVADQISDAILDAHLKEDPKSRVALETVITSGLIVLAGEISSQAHINYPDIVRKTLSNIGYTNSSSGFDANSAGIIASINKQSPDIARVIYSEKSSYKQQGAGDQGIMYGYASDDTESLMPLPIMLAHSLVEALKKEREKKTLPFLRPDAKSQVTVEYTDDLKPMRIHTVVLSTQHDEEISYSDLIPAMKSLIQKTLPHELVDENTRYFINPSGRFVIGGPAADTGVTGRKQMVDTYGGIARHGGGAFSGKDPSKVDRSAAYGARYAAKNIVASGLAKRCEVQLSYAIGVPYPLTVQVETFGTGKVSDRLLEKALVQVFDLTPGGLVQMLDLLRPIYLKTAYGGHFGREDPDFTWEKIDKRDELIKVLKKL